MSSNCPTCQQDLTGNLDPEFCDNCGAALPSSAGPAELSKTSTAPPPFLPPPPRPDAALPPTAEPESSQPPAPIVVSSQSAAGSTSTLPARLDSQSPPRRATPATPPDVQEPETTRSDLPSPTSTGRTVAPKDKKSPLSVPQAAPAAQQAAPVAAQQPTAQQPAAPQSTDTPSQPIRTPGSDTEKRYRELVDTVEENLRTGYELYGCVGLASSGKTHFLKALTEILDKHGAEAQAARRTWREAAVPAASRAEIFEYPCLGPGGEKWNFVDVGGELYAKLRENDWKFGDSHALAHWLQNCRGLFFFLHLNAGHFGQALHDDETLIGDEDTRNDLKARKNRAKEAQEELDFFSNFLLFLRALRQENGNVDKIIQRCQDLGNFEAALRTYRTSAPRLDIPVMFFFTQADTYLDQGSFEISDGIHLAPRRLPDDTMTFVARHLPYLFRSLVTQVEHFKFDFLQSYEETETGQLTERGKPSKITHWHAPGEPKTLLSVGLLAGFEFVLRNRPQLSSRPRLPILALNTRRALILHRLLNPKAWDGIQVDLGSWREPATSAADGDTP